MDFQDLVPIGVAFVVIGVVLSFGGLIVNDLQTDFVTGASGCNTTARTGCGFDYNASSDSQSGLGELADKLPLLGLVIAASIIIGVLLKAFVAK